MLFLPRTGDTLAQDVANLSLDLPALIPDFLYSQTSTMLAADPGIGKSIISMQLALSLASGSPLFGTFAIPVPQKVYYLQLEGSYPHAIERLRRMQSVVPLSAEHLCWDMGEGFNVLREADWLRVEARITRFGTPALLIIDPLYMLVAGGLSEDRPASAVVRFLTAMMQTFHCAQWVNHHTHRTRYHNGRIVEEVDPFYGSQWLKAHFDASWLMTRMGKSRVRLDCKKDRNGVLTKSLELIYHQETMTCENIKFAEAPAMAKVLAVIADCKGRNITISSQEICMKTGVSHSHLYRLQNEIGKMNLVKLHKFPGKDTLWEAV